MQSYISFQPALSSYILTENGSAPPDSGDPLLMGDTRKNEDVSLWWNRGLIPNFPPLTWSDYEDCFKVGKLVYYEIINAHGNKCW